MRSSATQSQIPAELQNMLSSDFNNIKNVPYFAFAKECLVSSFYEVQFWVEQVRIHMIMNIAVSVP